MRDAMKDGPMKLESIQAAEQKLMLNTYQRNPVLFVGGSGVTLRDEQGDEYLDLLSGIGVSALGYAHPAVEAAIAAQSKRLLHTSNLFYHEHTAELALRLTEISGLDRVFFCNSGTEAWEAALKLARAHAGLLRAEGKNGWDALPGGGTELPRTDDGRGCDDAQAEVPRAVWAGDGGRGVCALRRCGGPAREVQRCAGRTGLRQSASRRCRARAGFVR